MWLVGWYGRYQLVVEGGHERVLLGVGRVEAQRVLVPQRVVVLFRQQGLYVSGFL